MSGPVLPPELRLLTTYLTTFSPPQLLPLLPTLTSQVLQCRQVLHCPAANAASSSSPSAAVEGAHHVQRLRASISSLLNGRTPEGRLVGAALAKAVVDVGGLEAIKETGSWARGLLIGLQRNDPPPTKEFCLVTLTKIYLLLHAYPTLVREIATPTLPAFVAALIPLLSLEQQPAARNQKSLPPPLPASLVTLAVEAVATLVPLYPTTLRPFESAINAALRCYLAPTSGSTAVPVPGTLRRSSRRAFVLLHHAAAKAGGREVWTQQVHELFLRECYCAADQCFRAVEEAWQSGYRAWKSKIDFDVVPKGGGAGGAGGPNELPPWEGIRPGTERLVGVLECLAATLSYQTRTDVPVPLGELVDVCTRMSLVSRYNPRGQTWEQSLPTAPAVQRGEKEELWAAMPAIHVATMELLVVIVKRLQASAVPLTNEMLECLVRIFRSGIHVREVRAAGYRLLAALVRLCGPSFTKPTVASIDPLIAACCRDLQQDAGFVQSPPQPQPAADAKKPAAVAHADLFLAPSSSSSSTVSVPPLSKTHRAAAESLLVALLTHLPQHQSQGGAVKPPVRALLDRTAVLTQSREALLASVLTPYRDSTGKLYANLMPFLAGMHPAGQSIEVLRTNLRMDGGGGGGVHQWTEVIPPDTAGEKEEEEEEDDAMMGQDEAAPGVREPTTKEEEEPPIARNPAVARVTRSPSAEMASAFVSPAKRQHDGDADFRPLKRHETSAAAVAVSCATTATTATIHPTAESSQPSMAIASPAPSLVPDTKPPNDGSDSDDESVHLKMEFDDDDEDE